MSGGRGGGDHIYIPVSRICSKKIDCGLRMPRNLRHVALSTLWLVWMGFKHKVAFNALWQMGLRMVVVITWSGELLGVESI